MTRTRTTVPAVLAMSLAASMWILGCGDGATEPPPPPPPPPPVATTVAVSPGAAELTTVGATIQLGVEVRDQNGQSMAGAAVTWASDDASVATVDNAGLVTAAGNGTVTITATSGSASGNATVTVEQAVGAVSVFPAADTLVAGGDTLRLAAEAADANGHAVSGAEFSWASGDTLVATVDATGLVTAGSAGQVEITATSSGIEGRAALTVMHSVGSVVVSPAEGTITPGDTLRLVAEALDADGQRIANTSFAWSSSDVSVATVDASGLVAGVGEGAATITAMAGSVQGTARITVANPDRAALVALYEATDGPNWVNSENWLTDAPLDDWHGVDADASGRVVRVILSGGWDAERNGVVTHGLSGPIPPVLGSLTSLRELVLETNLLTGPIPAELGNLSNLRSLSLANNRLEGPIPRELANPSDLEVLRLGNNRLTGSVPAELGGLRRLRYLWLGGSPLTGGIPAELGNLANLQHLALGWSNLSGPIPPELGRLAKLKELWLSYNNLSGPIPPELGNLAELTALHLEENRLEGSVPQEIGRLDELVYLRLGGNAALAGPLPGTLSRLTSLRELSFEGTGLCAPSTASFRAWLRGLDDVRGERCAGNDVAVLTALYEATSGNGWKQSDGWLGDGALEEWYGVTADSLGRVVALDLSHNGLAGELPPGLGHLDQLIDLRIGGNRLTGGLPLSLARLSLQVFRYADTDLCNPVHESYQAWLNAIPALEGTEIQCAPKLGREILEALYQATDGPNWRHNGNWLSDAPLRDWYGVEVEEGGRVVGLRLSDNYLRGPIPPELGELASLRTLELVRNQLTGSIPLELGYLANLRTLNLLGSNLRGPIPPELGNLAELRILHLGYNELTGPIPPELGNLTNLRTLVLHGSWHRRVPRLEGPIPPELGNLANLRTLDLSLNHLTGSIPAELGSLAKLEHLSLERNRLSGPIPAVLGSLAALTRLSLITNGLTGPIPPEFGNLSRIGYLELKENNLAGPIPRALGNLANLVKLDLGANNLTGPIPPEIGNLSDAEFLLLEDNHLTGRVPPSLSVLTRLRQLYLAHNAALAGSLPVDLTALDELEELVAGGTDLCAPSDPAFAVWLEGVRKRWIAPCLEGDAPAAYLTQAVQSQEFPVPLVAGRTAMLRVFVTAARQTGAGIPPVRARFYRGGGETYVVDIPGKATPIPTEVFEGDLEASANIEIPGEIVQPGLEMVIEVDPDGTLDAGLLMAKRIPETGRMTLDVRALPPFNLTVVPLLWRAVPDSSVLERTRGMTADHDLFWVTRTLLPIGDFDVEIHEPVLIASSTTGAIIRDVERIWAVEGRKGHYHGLITGIVDGKPAGERWEVTGQGSAATRRVTFAQLGTVRGMDAGDAHEFGHNMSLKHPPGRAPDPTATHVVDFAFPHANGSIGAWGYDFRDGGALVPPSRQDVMGPTNTSAWISDYHFTNALHFRLSDEGAPAAAMAAARSLLLSGGTDSDGAPFLDPAFVVDAPPALPESGGEYEITGRTVDGDELFSLRFDMADAIHGDGESSFIFALPVEPGWAERLDSITLSGPGGSDTLDGDSDRPMTILRDPVTGQVRAILRDPPLATSADGAVAGDAASLAGPDVEVLFSRGIPGSREWRR